MVETRSRKRKRLDEEEALRRCRDRLSDLPDEILHAILSYLPIQFISQTATLSRRWNTLWLSYPRLDFSGFTPKGIQYEFLPALLNLRAPGTVKVCCLHNANISSSCISQCFIHLSSHSVEELDLDFNLNMNFPLPVRLLSFKSLKVLNLKAKYVSNINTVSVLLFPLFDIGSVSFKCMHSLSLSNVLFARFAEEFFSAATFPVLKTLNLRHCVGISKLKISCRSLEKVDIDGIVLTSLEIDGDKLEDLRVNRCFTNDILSTTVRVTAPSMHKFFWLGNLITDKFSVVCAKKMSRTMITFPCQRGSLSGQKVPSASALWRVLSLSSNLSIGYRVVEFLSDVNFAGCLPKCFNNLSTLTIHTGMRKHDLPGIVGMLRSSPFLSTIKFHVYNELKDLNDNSGRDLLDDPNFISKHYLESHVGAIGSLESHLRVVKIDIQGIRWSDTTVDMMRFLLRHGKVLQEMTIVSEMDPALSMQIISFEIKEFELASSNVAISIS